MVDQFKRVQKRLEIMGLFSCRSRQGSKGEQPYRFPEDRNSRNIFPGQARISRYFESLRLKQALRS